MKPMERKIITPEDLEYSDPSIKVTEEQVTPDTVEERPGLGYEIIGGE